MSRAQVMPCPDLLRKLNLDGGADLLPAILLAPELCCNTSLLLVAGMSSSIPPPFPPTHPTTNHARMCPYRALTCAWEGLYAHVCLLNACKILPNTETDCASRSMNAKDDGAGAAARAAIMRVREAGGRVCAFFSESILSCGGQVVLPPGYLQVAASSASTYPAVTVVLHNQSIFVQAQSDKAAPGLLHLQAVYAEMRTEGAVCVADEVTPDGEIVVCSQSSSMCYSNLRSMCRCSDLLIRWPAPDD